MGQSDQRYIEIPDHAESARTEPNHKDWVWGEPNHKGWVLVEAFEVEESKERIVFCNYNNS